MKYYFSKKSFDNLKFVDERIVALASYALATTPIDFSVTEGIRTVKTQEQYVQEGKSKTMDSNHLTGKAIDIYPLGASWDISDPKWKLLIDHFKECAKILKLDVTFGYDWGWDAPHLEV